MLAIRLTRLEQLRRGFIRSVLGLPRPSQIAATLTEAGAWPLSLLLQQRGLLHIDRLAHAPDGAPLLTLLAGRPSSKMGSLVETYHAVVGQVPPSVRLPPPQERSLVICTSLEGHSKRHSSSCTLLQVATSKLEEELAGRRASTCRLSFSASSTTAEMAGLHMAADMLAADPPGVPVAVACDSRAALQAVCLPERSGLSSALLVSEGVIRDSELVRRQYDSPQQECVIVQTAAGQRLSTSTEQDAGTPQEASETLQPHQGAQAQHYERSQPIGMHQHAGAALPQSAPPLDSGDSGMVTQCITISDSEDAVTYLETLLREEVAPTKESHQSVRIKSSRRAIIQQEMRSPVSDNSITGLGTPPLEEVAKLKSSQRDVQQELSLRSMTQQEINSRRSDSSLPSLKSPPLQGVARLQANQQALQLKPSRQGMMQQRSDSSATDHLVPSLSLPTQEQVARTTAVKWDSPPWLQSSGAGQAGLTPQSVKKLVPAVRTPYVEESAVTHAIASTNEQVLQLLATKKLSMLHRQRRPRSPSASTSQMERHPSDHVASVPNTSVLPSAAKPGAPAGDEVVEEMNDGGTQEESSQISECSQPTLASSDEHSSRASYHEDSAAGQPRNANYAQPYQLATMPFLRRARQIRLRSPPNMSFFNVSDFPPASNPWPEFTNIDLEPLSERDTQDELQLLELLQGAIMPSYNPSSDVKTCASTTSTGQPSSVSLSTVPNALPRRMPFAQTTYFPYSTASQDAQILVSNVPHPSTAEQSYERMQPHVTYQEPIIMPSQGAAAATSEQAARRTIPTGNSLYAQGTPSSSVSASSYDNAYFASASTSESAQVSTPNMPHASTRAQNYEHLQQPPIHQHSSFLLSQGATAAPSDQGTKRDISAGPVLFAQETPLSSLSASSYDIAYSAPTTSEGAQAFPHNMPHTGTVEHNYENLQPLTSFLQSQGAIAAPSVEATKPTASTGSILIIQGTPSSSFSGSLSNTAYIASPSTSEGMQIFNRTMPLSSTPQQNYEHVQPHPTYQEPIIMPSQGAPAATTEQAARRTIPTGNIFYVQATPSSSISASSHDTADLRSSSTSESAQVSNPNMPHASTRAQNYEHLQQPPMFQYPSFLLLQGATAAPSNQGTKRDISTAPVLHAQKIQFSSLLASSYDIAYSAPTTSEGAQAFSHNMPHTGTAEHNSQNLQQFTTYQQPSFLHSQGAIAAPSDQATIRTTSTRPVLFAQGTPSSSFSGSSYGTAYFASSSTSESPQVFNRTVPHSGTAEQNYERTQPYPTYQQPSVMPSQGAGAASSDQATRRTISAGSLSYAQGAPSSALSTSSYDTPYSASSSTSESAQVFTHNMPHSSITAQNYEHLQQNPTYQQPNIAPSQGERSDQERRRII
ncbi:mucin-5AC-like [Dermacentor silvarum]|uniref:mucin-5AC-like n=1 Tax=Dermacentor silvarum TaxID=543639 RepID=UPI00210132F0|nr:mucin-5AC-like [Dermacentor silvarum]